VSPKLKIVEECPPAIEAKNVFLVYHQFFPLFSCRRAFVFQFNYTYLNFLTSKNVVKMGKEKRKGIHNLHAYKIFENNFHKPSTFFKSYYITFKFLLMNYSFSITEPQKLHPKN
jgi:hypothetical protein